MCSKELYAEDIATSLIGKRVRSTVHLQFELVCNPLDSGAGAGSLHPGQRTSK